MIFTQRLFTLLLGVLFATVLTDQASALYDPGVGRFCSRDPIGYLDSNGLYSITEAGTLKETDPLGLCSVNWTGSDCSIDKFVDWFAKELAELPTWLPLLKPCPCSLGCTGTFDFPETGCQGLRWHRVRRKYKICPYLPDGFVRMTFPNWGNHHPGTTYELRENTCENRGNSCSPGNQCTYDSDGNLLTTLPSAGTADRYSGGCGTLFNSPHVSGDVDPYECAKKLDRRYGLRLVNFYYKVRPANGGKACAPMPNPYKIVEGERKIPTSDLPSIYPEL
jgi:hypothetical protein